MRLMQLSGSKTKNEINLSELSKNQDDEAKLLQK